MSDPRQTRRACRIDSIIEAARRCFARWGFHATSVQSICSEAGMSPGNLYRYFASKEALVEAMCAQEMEDLKGEFARVVGQDDFYGSIWQLISRQILQRDPSEIALWIETIAESTRNADVARITRTTRETIRDSIFRALETARQNGHVPAHADVSAITEYMLVYADGLILSRVRNPDTDLTPAIRMLLNSLAAMLTDTHTRHDSAPAGAPSTLGSTL